MRRLIRWRAEWPWLAALLLLLTLHFWFPRINSGGGRDTYGIGGEGKKAFYQLIDGNYWLVWRNSEPIGSLVDSLDRSAALCILGPARYPTHAEWQQISAWVQRGGSLLFAARYRDPAVEIDTLKIKIEEAKSEAEKEEVDDDGLAQMLDAIDSTLSGTKGSGWLTHGKIDSSGGTVLVSSGGTPQAVVQQHGAGKIVILASDFVFSNQSLAWNDFRNSVLAVRLFEAAGDSSNEIVFDESLNESGTPKVVAILLNPTLRPLTVQLLIGLLIFGWWRSRRFGSVESAEVSARQNIVDHTDALGNLYYRTHDSLGVLRSYLRQLSWELRLKRSKGREATVLGPIAARLERSTDDVRNEIRDASQAARGKNLDRASAAAFIRRLATIRRAALEAGITRTRGSKTQNG
jgi:hypothetical protein